MCEGQIDCIRCHLAGFTNVVASQGTALTEDHARLLKRYADEVLIVLDADTAGQNAALRAAEVLLAAGLSIRIAALPKGEDPDSLIRKQGRESFERVLAGATGALEFQANLLRSRGELDSEAGKNRAAKAMLELIARAPTAVQRDLLLHQAAELLGVSEAALREDSRRVTRAPARAVAEAEPEKPVAHPADEVTILELLVQHPEVAPEIRQYLPPELLTDADCRAIYEQLRAAPEGFNAAVTEMSAERQRLAAQIQMTPTRIMGHEFTPQQAARDVILAIVRAALERQRAEKKKQRETATADSAAYDQLTHEISQLTLDLKNLQQGWAKAQMILALLGS